MVLGAAKTEKRDTTTSQKKTRQAKARQNCEKPAEASKRHRSSAIWPQTFIRRLSTLKVRDSEALADRLSIDALCSDPLLSLSLAEDQSKDLVVLLRDLRDIRIYATHIPGRREEWTGASLAAPPSSVFSSSFATTQWTRCTMHTAKCSSPSPRSSPVRFQPPPSVPHAVQRGCRRACHAHPQLYRNFTFSLQSSPPRQLPEEGATLPTSDRRSSLSVGTLVSARRFGGEHSKVLGGSISYSPL